MSLGYKLSTFVLYTFKTREPCKVYTLLWLNHCSVVPLVKEMSTSSASVSEWRTFSYLFWIALVLLWPSLAEESWMDSFTLFLNKTQQRRFPPSGILCIPLCQRVNWWVDTENGCSYLQCVHSAPCFFVRQVGSWWETSWDVNAILVSAVMISCIMWPSCV